MKRGSGILLPVFSLPSDYGIGAFDEAAYHFIDQLAKMKQSYWQVLPLGPTGYGDSPYQSFSTFAGNPYFISLKELQRQKLLKEEECVICPSSKDYIDYEKLFQTRFRVLKKAFQRSKHQNTDEYKAFCEENEFWLEDYALYMAIKDVHGGKSMLTWEKEILMRDSKSLGEYKERLQEEVDFYCYIQYEFYRQWDKLKAYANKKGVKIIGDIPIYVALDSADVWANKELFQLDENGYPTAVAGCPPDSFSATGQLWGNPLYDWEYHKKTKYQWWVKRMQHCAKIYDVVRIDHFRGFDEYYSIPYGEETAENGSWKKGPGTDLFQQIKNDLGELNIIAEDLGFITDTVQKLLEDTGFPGMKVLEFAFDSREESDYLPHNYKSNSVVYTGTHDNSTVAGWLSEISPEDKEYMLNYIGEEDKNIGLEELIWKLIRLAMGSVSDLCIIPMQDYLGLDDKARINIPSTIGGNWTWRMSEKAVTKETIQDVKKLTILFGREN